MLRTAVIGLQPGQAQAGVRRDEARQTTRRRRRDAAAPLADIDLDEHIDRAARGLHRARQTIDAERRINRDREVHAVRQRGNAREAVFGDHLVADEDVGDALRRERLGFRGLLHAHADRAGGHLQARDLRALVRLRVRPQPQAAFTREPGHARDVALHRVEIDHERG